MATAFPLASAYVHEADPVLAAIASAPVDETPETEEERAAVEEGMAAIRAGRWVPREEIQSLIDGRRRDEG